MLGPLICVADQSVAVDLFSYVLKFPNFRCYDNKGPSENYFHDIVKLHDLENRLVQES